MPDKILSIVIPCYNKYSFTKNALKDLSHLPKDKTEIIVVDNGSNDDTQSKLQFNTDIVYIRNDINYGFSKACNQGYHISTAPNVLFLNNDIRVKNPASENWTERLLAHCSDSLVGPTMGQLDDNFNFVQEANKELPGNSYMSGWCLASSKKVWQKLIIGNNIGPWDEDFFAYFEDSSLSFTARKLGIPFKVVDLPVVHFGKQTSSQLNVHKLYSEARKIFISKWKR